MSVLLLAPTEPDVIHAILARGQHAFQACCSNRVDDRVAAEAGRVWSTRPARPRLDTRKDSAAVQEMTAHEAAKECKGVYLGETPSILRPQDLGIGLLFERMREGVIVADVQSGRIFLWNPGAEKIFGYAADEAVGLPL